MLQGKVYFALSNKVKIKANKKLRTGKEMNQMLCYADNNLI